MDRATWIIVTICLSVGILIGMNIGKAAREGESYDLKPGTYNVVHVMGESKETDGPGQELLVSDLDDPNDHHFVVVSDKCFANFPKGGVNLVTMVNRDFCLWVWQSPPPQPDESVSLFADKCYIVEYPDGSTEAKYPDDSAEFVSFLYYDTCAWKRKPAPVRP